MCETLQNMNNFSKMNAVNNSGTIICFTFYQEITFVYVMNGVYLEDGTRISSQANEIPALS